MRRGFKIAENKPVRLWKKNPFEELNKPHNSIQKAGLNQNDVIVIEQHSG